MTIVLLFNNCAPPSLAARLHASTCPMVRTAKRRGSVTKLCEPSDDDIADLNERGYPVKRCKCCNEESELIKP